MLISSPTQQPMHSRILLGVIGTAPVGNTRELRYEKLIEVIEPDDEPGGRFIFRRLEKKGKNASHPL